MTENDESLVCEKEERDKANACLQELIDVFDKHKLRVQDLVVVYGNLGYALGGSIEGIPAEGGPSFEELQQKYYAEPTLGVALMFQGMLVTSWHDQVSKGLTVEELKDNKGE